MDCDGSVRSRSIGPCHFSCASPPPPIEGPGFLRGRGALKADRGGSCVDTFDL